MRTTPSTSHVEKVLAADGVPLLVPKKTVADLLHVHTRTIDRLIASRQLRAIRTTPHGSGRILIPRAALAAMLEALGVGDSFAPAGASK